MKLPIRKEVNDGWVSIVDANGDAWFEGTGNGTEGTAADLIATACNAHDRLVKENASLRLDLDLVRGSLEVADKAMQNAASAQAQLVEALRAMLNAEDDGMDYQAMKAAQAALAAAGITT